MAGSVPYVHIQTYKYVPKVFELRARCARGVCVDFFIMCACCAKFCASVAWAYVHINVCTISRVGKLSMQARVAMQISSHMCTCKFHAWEHFSHRIFVQAYIVRACVSFSFCVCRSLLHTLRVQQLLVSAHVYSKTFRMYYTCIYICRYTCAYV